MVGGGDEVELVGGGGGLAGEDGRARVRADAKPRAADGAGVAGSNR